MCCWDHVKPCCCLYLAGFYDVSLLTTSIINASVHVVEPSWNVMVQVDAREGKWKGNWRIDWVASTLHATSNRGVSSITTADAHTSSTSSRLNCCPCQFKWTRPFRRKTKYGFCTCSITFQNESTNYAPSYYCCSTEFSFVRKDNINLALDRDRWRGTWECGNETLGSIK